MGRNKRIGIIGPTSTDLIEQTVGLAAGTLEQTSREMGAFLAENRFAMVSVPARGVGLWSMESYKEAGGDDALALAPKAAGSATESSDKTRNNARKADQVRDDLTWGDEPVELAKASDFLVVIGLSCGTLMEMVATKWLKAPPLLVDASLITRIPDEVLAELDVRFFENMAALKAYLLPSEH